MIWKTEENFQISSSMVNHKNVENPEKFLKTRDSLKTYRSNHLKASAILQKTFSIQKFQIFILPCNSIK